MTQTDEFINELLDAIIEAISPSMVSRDWIKKFIKPIVDKYLSE